ncbi:enoyl-CoA delta isomerase 3, peroxisomal-like [Hylaeus anthracinus]|uniref:enoyl-CoA delta isomerase 3, peroxisomal-like n=1 Tax=Hylaeus anthracinus TaxID=313031 RepID=UPI0023B99637|nr:enoyl-CoA delta isomerase 3, peroxisomal-like [Hylaeus anthracinus]XP_054014943.1 enoyl-CoA delta isomerase 3, peroxisomal-like [Hylaeus anthracinus]
MMETKNSSDILCSLENGIQKIVLNRPKKKNAITKLMYEEISRILDEAIQNDKIYVVVLTGTGNFFSSGNDFLSLATSQGNDSESLENTLSNFKNFVERIITFPKLLVAVVNGPAIGIAVTILPLFDMVYASHTATFQTPFTSLGLVAEGCSTYTFPKIFGHSKAGDMLYLGYKMNALEAKQYGLVSEVYKEEHLNDVWIYLKTVSLLSPKSIVAIKHLVRKWNKQILLEVNSRESAELLKFIQSSDFIERLINTMSRKSKI